MRRNSRIWRDRCFFFFLVLLGFFFFKLSLCSSHILPIWHDFPILTQIVEYSLSKPESWEYYFVPAKDVGQMKGSISSNIVILFCFVFFLCPSFEVTPGRTLTSFGFPEDSLSLCDDDVYNAHLLPFILRPFSLLLSWTFAPRPFGAGHVYGWTGGTGSAGCYPFNLAGAAAQHREGSHTCMKNKSCWLTEKLVTMIGKIINRLVAVVYSLQIQEQ